MTTIAMPLCPGCRHFNRDGGWGFRCAAFPAGIPEAIITSEVDHREPFEGDQDIQFDPIDDEAIAYAEMLFSPLLDEPYVEEDDEESDAAHAEVA